MAAAALTTERLSRWFRGTDALQSVSIDFLPGCITVVVGAPGAGKTTLMRLLAGLDRPNGGSVALNGERITHVPARRRGFGIVQQPDHLFPHMTIAQNVGLPLRVRGVSRAERAPMVQNVLELAQIAEAGGLRPDAASPWQAERAVLARAAVFGPGVLLLDEPFGGEAAQDVAETVAVLRRFQSLLGSTTVVATSHVAAALALCDRVVVLHEGAVAQTGTPDDLFYRPRTEYVAGLLGDMNLLEGVVEELGADMVKVRLACGPVVEAARGGVGLEEHKACVVVLRPDVIAIAAMPSAEMGEGAIDARLLEAQFWGDSYKLRLLIGTGAELLVRRPAIGGLRGLSPARAASVAWQPQHAMAFRR